MPFFNEYSKKRHFSKLIYVHISDTFMLGWGKTASKQKQGHLSNWVYEKLSQKHSCLYALAVYGPPVTQESGSEKATGGQKVGKSSLFIPVGKLVFEI